MDLLTKNIQRPFDIIVFFFRKHVITQLMKDHCFGLLLMPRIQKKMFVFTGFRNRLRNVWSLIAMLSKKCLFLGFTEKGHICYDCFGRQQVQWMRF